MFCLKNSGYLKFLRFYLVNEYRLKIKPTRILITILLSSPDIIKTSKIEREFDFTSAGKLI